MRYLRWEAWPPRTWSHTRSTRGIRRFLFGIGTGWLREEVELFGGDFPKRWTQTREALDAMKAVWTNDAAGFDGTYYKFPPVRVYPKPIQKPYPPILLGGAFPFGARRAIEYGDGWMPIGGRDQDPLEIGRRFRQMVAESGRDPASVPMSVYGPRHEIDQLRALRDAGMDRAVLAIATAPRDATLKKLDELAELVAALG